MSDEAWDTVINALKDLTYDKFSQDFSVSSAYYTSANGLDSIRVHLLVPRAWLSTQTTHPRPVLVRIHGGYLVTGSSLYPPWLGDWVLQLALRAGAIIVSPNYRLMPEATGLEILEDMDAFWKWLRQGGVDAALAKEGNSAIRTDLDHVLVLGESAGGYLATQLALSYPQDISALVALYPLLDPESPFYTTAYSKPILGISNRPLDLLKDHVSNLGTTPEGLVRNVTEADPPDRLALSFAIVQHGLYLEYLGRENKVLFPMRRLESDTDADGVDRGKSIPPMFICHGKDDSAVPCEGTQLFIDHLTKLRPFARHHLELQPGDHGFDGDASIDESEWLKRGLDFVLPSWLEQGTAEVFLKNPI